MKESFQLLFKVWCNKGTVTISIAVSSILMWVLEWTMGVILGLWNGYLSFCFSVLGVGVWSFFVCWCYWFVSSLSYEIKATKDRERYSREVKKANAQPLHRPAKEADKHKPRLKSSASDQQKLDKIFHDQIEKKGKLEQPVKIVTVPFSLSSCRHHLQRQERNVSDELFLIRRQSFPDVWILATEKNVKLLNPYRLEEALLRKRLLMNHKLPVEKLGSPIVLTDRYSTIEQKCVCYLKHHLIITYSKLWQGPVC